MNQTELHEFIVNLEFIKENSDLKHLYNQFGFLVREAMKIYDTESIEKLMESFFKDFLFGADVEMVKDFSLLLDEVTQYHLTNKNDEYLARVYLIQGHLNFVHLNHQQAEAYYEDAISYGIKYENFSTVSIATLNIAVMHFGDWSNERLWSMSKSVLTFYKMQPNYSRVELFSKAFLHLEMACKMKKFDYFQEMYDYIMLLNIFKPSSRERFQLRGLEMYKYYEMGDHDFVLKHGKELLRELLDQPYTDLTRAMYDRLIDSYKEVGQLDKAERMQQRLDKFIAELEEYQQHIESKKNFEVSLKLVPGAVHMKNFQEEAEKLLSRTYESEKGYTLLILEFDVYEHVFDEQIEQIMEWANTEIMCAFYKVHVVRTRFSPTMLAFLIELEEEEIQHRINEMAEGLRSRYPKDERGLARIIYGYVNNKKNNYYSYNECLQLAYAHMYYGINRMED